MPEYDIAAPLVDLHLVYILVQGDLLRPDFGVGHILY